MTYTDFDLDDEPVLAAESEVAAAICSHQVVMQRGDALTADMLDELHGFVQEELAALLEEKNAKIAYLRAIANGKFADAAQMRLHHAGLEEDKTFVLIAAHLAAQFKAIGATYAATPEEITARHKAFLRKWRLKHRAVADSLEEAGDSLFAFARLPPSQWKSARTTNAIERLHEEFKRRIKTQTVLPSADTAAMLFWALLASGQISMRKVDGWQTLASKFIDQPIDLAA